MSANYFIAKPVLLGYVRYAQQFGFELTKDQQHSLIQETGEAIPFPTFATVLETICDTLAQQHIGLYFGSQSTIAALGVVGQLIQSADTIRAALHQATNAFQLVSNVIHMEVIQQEQQVHLVFTVAKNCQKAFPIACQELLISSMLFAAKEVHFLTLKKATPNKIHLQQNYANKALLEAHFQSQLVLQQEKNRIVFDAQWLDEKIAYADHELYVQLEKLVCKRLQLLLNETSSFTSRVRETIYKLLEPQFPSLATVASHFHMSERVFQRKLKANGTSYSALLTDVKKELAKDYITRLSIQETAYLLGYSETSAFSRAFKSWHNTTPSNYIQTLKSTSENA